ncbi:MAG: biopolymer transporter ExbD [Cytophagaceae bacterium]|nr:biopolymer transporter ExbD [Cytophagaceae bacterium]MDW8457262.1 biopolymer transporter ExbD [Cytophagaceae bacterium]
MAEIEGGGGGKQKTGKVRSKKVSTKVDMTPMVDLAFLLITFFMLTTTLSKPQVMKITMPYKDKDKKNQDMQDLKASRVLNLILGEEDEIYYYHGLDQPQMEVTDYSADGIRKIFNEKKKTVDTVVVIIKAMDKSKFKNIVDILDEVHITNIRTYSIVDITPEDLALVAKEKEVSSASTEK